MVESHESQILGNLYDKKEIKRLKKLGLTDREIRNLRAQQTSGGKMSNLISKDTVQTPAKSESEKNNN